MERVVHRLLGERPGGLSHLEREPGRGDKRVGAHVDRAAGELAEVIGTHKSLREPLSRVVAAPLQGIGKSFVG